MSDKDNMKFGFLGQEFLLWLYWRSSEDSFFDLQDFNMDNIELFLEEHIALDSITGDGYAESIKAKDITELEDIKKSIRSGRIPSSVKIRVIKGKLEWFFQLKATPLTVKSVKLPIVGEKGEVELIGQRLLLLEMLDNIMKALFNLFILEREEESFVKDLKSFLELS
jgi:hypothetical protein